MTHIRTQDDLIAMVLNNAPTKACATVIRERGATVLGRFNPVQNLPGWIVQVDSPYGKQWIIGIELNEATRRYRVVYLETVPWDDKIGELP